MKNVYRVGDVVQFNELTGVVVGVTRNFENEEQLEVRVTIPGRCHDHGCYHEFGAIIDDFKAESAVLVRKCDAV